MALGAPVSEKMAQSAYHAAALGCSPLDPQALGMLGLGGHGAGNSAAAAAAAAAYQRHLLSGGLALPLASIAHLGRGQERLLRQQAAGMDLCNPRNSDDSCEKDKSRNPDPNGKSKSPGWPPGDAETGSVLNLSQNGGGTRARDVDVFRTRDDDDGQGESDYAEDRDQGDLSEDSEASTSSTGGGDPKRHRAPSQDGDSQLQQFMDRTGLLAARGSVETLLQNILGLLKVAEENARQQEQQVHMERAELKVEILRERELREGLEKKLQEEQNKRVFYQKRLRREKRCRRQVQDQLEGEVKKRVRYEEALRTTLAESQIPKALDDPPQKRRTSLRFLSALGCSFLPGEGHPPIASLEKVLERAHDVVQDRRVLNGHWLEAKLIERGDGKDVFEATPSAPESTTYRLDTLCISNDREDNWCASAEQEVVCHSKRAAQITGSPTGPQAENTLELDESSPLKVYPHDGSGRGPIDHVMRGPRAARLQ
ncbi:hypothetical protein HPB47_021879 [Ixodes persulcatus]|uniref:Uncharacterized protein n=1 Tax=Ixodes persulcatus TaxID=34615 RepID=A0AC60QC82_IXOPE|nr:hypothetical protein HPB47_021879 [Ixodes persulcatus]